MSSRPLSIVERLESRVVRRVVAMAEWAPVAGVLQKIASTNGAAIDPGVRAVLALRTARGAKPTHELGPIEARRRFSREAQVHAGELAAVADVRDLTLPLPSGTQRARLYVPAVARPGSGLLVYYHGGGFVIGDIEMYDPFCRQLCRDSGLRVLSIEYALAPEHPFPAAIEDAYGAFRWAVEHAASLGADPSRIAVGGDSAGGNLSAVVAQRCVHDDATRPKMQLLIYPAVDRTGRYSSLHNFGEGFLLSRQEIEWYHETYMGGPHIDRADPRISPLLGDVAGTAPALVITAGLDPLCDEGDAYAAALQRAGVHTEHVRLEGLIHGFINMIGPSRSCRDAVNRVAQKAGEMVSR